MHDNEKSLGKLGWPAVENGRGSPLPPPLPPPPPPGWNTNRVDKTNHSPFLRRVKQGYYFYQKL
jgi:hypothetical protein